MRKLMFFLLVLLFTGCGANLNIEGKITEIKFNDIYINRNDFEKIKNMVEKSYYEDSDDLHNTLIIKTEKNIYNFKLSNSYISYNGKQAEDNNTYNYLQRLTKKYKNRNFYKIKYVKDLKEENNEIISLDRTSNYIVINLNKKVTNFKINQISSDGDKFSDIDLLYSKDSVNDEVVIRKSIGYQSPDIRISFTNEYGFRFSIIPQHNNDKLEFVTEVKQEI